MEHGTEGVVRAATMEDVRPGHDSFFVVHNDVVVLKIKQNGTILLEKRAQKKRQSISDYRFLVCEKLSNYLSL